MINSITRRHVTALILLAQRVGFQADAERHFWAARLLEKEVTSFSDLTDADYRRIWGLAYPDGVTENWEPATSFVGLCAHIAHEYQQLQGQMRLPSMEETPMTEQVQVTETAAVTQAQPQPSMSYREWPVVLFTAIIHPTIGVEFHATVRGLTLDEAHQKLAAYVRSKLADGWLAVPNRDGQEILQQHQAVQRAKAAKEATNGGNGKEKRAQPPAETAEKELPPPKSATPRPKVAPAPPASKEAPASGGLTMPAETITPLMSQTGKLMYKVKGGRYKEHGVTCWPEVAEWLNDYMDTTAMQVGMEYDISQHNLTAVCEVNEKGNPSKVLTFQA